MLASYSLNVGGLGSYGNPGNGNAWIAGTLGIGTTTLAANAKLQVDGGAIIAGVTIGACDTSINGNFPWIYETVGVSQPTMNLRLLSPKSIFFHTGDKLTERVKIYDDGVNIQSKSVGSLMSYMHSDGRIHSEYMISCGKNDLTSCYMTCDGEITADVLKCGVKYFIIHHPLNPRDKNLVHACIEGPELAVYYRGEGRLNREGAEVVLPEYFEKLVRTEGRTVLITPIWEDNSLVSCIAASEVRDGRFWVRAIDDKNPNQRFYWEVKGVRADVDPLEVEKDKK